MADSRITLGIKLVIAFHALNLVIWFFGQTWAVFDYDQAAEWGLQDKRELVDPIIVEVNRGIGLTDTLVMFPLHIIGIIGLLRMKMFGAVCSWMVMGMGIYWPVIFWTSQFFYGKAGLMYQPAPPEFIIVPGVFAAISIWASWYLFKKRRLFD